MRTLGLVTCLLACMALETQSMKFDGYRSKESTRYDAPEYPPKPSYQPQFPSRYSSEEAYSEDANDVYTYRGMYEGQCDFNGLYYKDDTSFVICSGGNGFVQPCAPGTQNSPYTNYDHGGRVDYRNFCDVNMLNFGFRVVPPPPKKPEPAYSYTYEGSVDKSPPRYRYEQPYTYVPAYQNEPSKGYEHERTSYALVKDSTFKPYPVNRDLKLPPPPPPPPQDYPMFEPPKEEGYTDMRYGTPYKLQPSFEKQREFVYHKRPTYAPVDPPKASYQQSQPADAYNTPTKYAYDNTKYNYPTPPKEEPPKYEPPKYEQPTYEQPTYEQPENNPPKRDSVPYDYSKPNYDSYSQNRYEKGEERIEKKRDRYRKKSYSYGTKNKYGGKKEIYDKYGPKKGPYVTVIV